MEGPSAEKTSAGTDLFAAVGRNLLVFVAPIAVLVALALAYGLIRTPLYTAEARVSIGQLNVSTQGIPGFLTAAQNLAAAYARSIGAPDVAKAAAAQARIPEDKARGEITASAIPSTPLFRVEATDASPGIAVALANGATDGLIRHVLNLNQRANTRANLYTKYKGAAKKIARLERELKDLGEDGDAEELDAKTAELEQAILRRNTIGKLYEVSAAGSVASNLLQVTVPASHASSDRKEVIERWVLIAALVGLLAGLVLAAGREASVRRRENAAA